jgi:regulatory protein
MKELNPISEATALSRLMQICSRAEKSAFEIGKKLKEWGLEAKADQIINKLVREGFIDDTRFAIAFSKDKIVLNKWGKIKVRFLLKGYHIPDKDIRQALDRIDDQQYQDIVFAELDKKKSSLKKYPVLQLKSKLYAFGAQRGYEPDLMHRYFELEQL